jgi:hypothetical protein
MQRDLREERQQIRRIAIGEEDLYLGRYIVGKISFDKILIYPTQSYEHLFQSNRLFKAIPSPLGLEKRAAVKKIKKVRNQHPLRTKRKLLEMEKALTEPANMPQVGWIAPKVTIMLLEIED